MVIHVGHTCFENIQAHNALMSVQCVVLVLLYNCSKSYSYVFLLFKIYIFYAVLFLIQVEIKLNKKMFAHITQS